MKTIALSTLLLLLAAYPLQSQELIDTSKLAPGTDIGAVYAKVILPVKTPVEGLHPVVESWIVQRLKKEGEKEWRAVTQWTLLSEKEGDSTCLRGATVLGGCPVNADVSERSADGKVRVDLTGWSPAGAEVKGGILSADIGSRGFAIVDSGRADGRKSYVALMMAPAFDAKNGETKADEKTGE